ncbi:MAG: cobalt-precorrin-5B (C(1))-methyltransferase CbiD [Lachnospiraceae bacterium]|nr:cobalt-precorrin-5B (C(1))-methyltransferase CbiD [Lachnospiraceae bacterium]MDD7326931.1 cobalt-precorrin-5B (C(1))-methyltransferase CbiD [Lachnospiraceae bacterium]MDY2759959.1 cobalt-precorrin-5B (C(1))-methyltransferase CbiD [Lachnospiraceae bacterium]
MKELRSGFTTGSCAAFASRAAACHLLLGFIPKDIAIITPRGVRYSPAYHLNADGSVEVKKDAGDDPDVTDGMIIRAGLTCDYKDSGDIQVIIDGGRGVGRVTKPGLDQPVGNAAINHIPREMVTENVMEVAEKADFHGTITVIIEADGGEEVAEKTFNPRLGIIGGISILGTSGIVEPMSDDAIIDTIRVEIHQRRVLGEKRLVMAFGNYGQEFLLRDYGVDLESAVKCSNFIEDALTIAEDEGFRDILLVGHLGKIVKVAGGFSNTHSKYGDCRMEILTSALLRSDADTTVDDLKALDACNTTEEAADFLASKRYMTPVMEVIRQEILDTIKRWIPDVHVDLMIYTINQGLIGTTINRFSGD